MSNPISGVLVRHSSAKATYRGLTSSPLTDLFEITTSCVILFRPVQLRLLTRFSTVRSSDFGEDVFVLPIADDEDAFASALTDNKFETVIGRVDGNEGDGSIVILARRHGALPFTEIKDS
jgi:hypothetical protein